MLIVSVVEIGSGAFMHTCTYTHRCTQMYVCVSVCLGGWVSEYGCVDGLD